MPRYKLTIEYDGRPFVGWQRQAAGRSVQGAIEAAAARAEPEGAGAGWPGRRPVVQGAGRTDAGVHARGQVAHLDMARAWDPDRLKGALNAHLRPDPVAILRVEPAAEAFHARFDAIGRAYRYRLLCRRAPAAIDRGFVWQIGHALDLDAMRAAAAHLVGRHDFTTFRSAQCQSVSPVKTLDEIAIGTPAPAGGDTGASPEGAEVWLDFRARSFLHNQVRSLVGTLERVGAGAWQPGDVAAALAARDRAACGPVAPPDGLCLVGVAYPPPAP